MDLFQKQQHDEHYPTRSPSASASETKKERSKTKDKRDKTEEEKELRKERKLGRKRVNK